MGNHARPSGDKAHFQKTDADHGPQDADAPHPGNVVEKRHLCLADTHHQPLHNDRHPVEWLRDRYHAQDCATQGDDLPALGENSNQERGGEKERRTGKDHQHDLNGQEHIGKGFHAFPVPRTVGVSSQSSGSSLHWDVKGRFHRVGDGVGSGSHLTHAAKTTYPKEVPKR